MGSTEHWKIIPSHPRYEASNLGHIRRASTGRIRKPRMDARGYFIIRFVEDGRLRERKLSRLIAEAFLGPSTLMVRHLNDDRLDNRIENLKYGTAKDNARDYFENKKGGLLREKEAEVLQLRSEGLSQDEIAVKLQVSRESISRIFPKKKLQLGEVIEKINGCVSTQGGVGGHHYETFCVTQVKMYPYTTGVALLRPSLLHLIDTPFV